MFTWYCKILMVNMCIRNTLSSIYCWISAGGSSLTPFMPSFAKFKFRIHLTDQQQTQYCTIGFLIAAFFRCGLTNNNNIFIC
jgi:hypothetical protein